MANWTDLSGAFGYGTKLTSQQMQQLRDNITALSEGASGAPEIVNSALKTSTGNANGSVSALSSVQIVMADYCFFPNLYTNNMRYVEIHGSIGGGGCCVGKFSFHNEHDANSYNYAADWKYITATGESIIIALINKITGAIEHIWSCEDDVPVGWPASSPIKVIDKDDKLIDYNIVSEINVDKSLIRYLNDKAIMDKNLSHQILNDEYEFDNDLQIFKLRNLGEI